MPILQTSAQVVAFLSGHLGFPFPSPVLLRQLGERFRKAVASFAEANDIPWVRFGKDEAKLEVMAPHLARQASTGRSGVAAIGVAQEFQRVWTAYEGKTSTGTPRWSFVKSDRRVTCYYFYLWDVGFGPAFIKVCAYFPYPAKIWLNGHEWVKRQAEKAGLGFTALSNGFAACNDPAALQVICDRLQPGTGQRCRASSRAGPESLLRALTASAVAGGESGIPPAPVSAGAHGSRHDPSPGRSR